MVVGCNGARISIEALNINGPIIERVVRYQYFYECAGGLCRNQNTGVHSQSELNNQKYLTHIESRTLRWKEISKQENKSLLLPTRLTVVNREQKAAQSFGPITIAKDYVKV